MTCPPLKRRWVVGGVEDGVEREPPTFRVEIEGVHGEVDAGDRRLVSQDVAASTAAMGIEVDDQDAVGTGVERSPCRERAPIERATGIGRAAEQGDRSHLGIAVRTVESHLRRMYDRYGCSDRVELLSLAREQGWIAGG